MTLREAIVHAEEAAKRSDLCAKYRAEQAQIAEWLKELEWQKAWLEEWRRHDYGRAIAGEPGPPGWRDTDLNAECPYNTGPKGVI